MCPTFLTKSVDFHRGDADCVVRAANDRGVVAGRQERRDRRFVVVGRLDRGRACCLRFGWIVFPVVVRAKQRAVSVVQFHDRIGICHAEMHEALIVDPPPVALLDLRRYAGWIGSRPDRETSLDLVDCAFPVELAARIGP